jgi:CheY-like chemotaxis protein
MRVLLVDDSADIRELQGMVLRGAGYEIAEADSGATALELLRGTESVDLVILDAQMPYVDGWATLEALRADPKTADIPALLCTVRAGPDDLARAWRLGADGYLSKPFAVTDLVTCVREVTARSAAERAALRAQRAAEAGSS